MLNTHPKYGSWRCYAWTLLLQTVMHNAILKNHQASQKQFKLQEVNLVKTHWL